MKPLEKKTDASTPPFFGFKDFMAAVLRNRIFLFCAALDIIALILAWFKLVPLLLPVYYVGLAFVGFVWAAFRAYRDLSLAYRDVVSPQPVEKVLRSEISISFPVGNEYAYSISDPYVDKNLYITRMQKTRGVKCRFDERGIFFINGKVYYPMTRASLTINFRVENTGDLPLEVLTVHFDNNLDLNYLKLFNDDVFESGKKLRFPFSLKSGEFVLLQAQYKISAGKDSSNDLFAADFRALPRLILHELSFDTRDVHGREQTMHATIEVPSKPLIDLYVKQWREFDQDEYLFLAGQSTAGLTAVS